MEAKWSQSRVLPSAGLAYETGLSAGSIAVLADGHLGTRPKVEPPPGIAPAFARSYGGAGRVGSPTERAHH